MSWVDLDTMSLILSKNKLLKKRILSHNEICIKNACLYALSAWAVCPYPSGVWKVSIHLKLTKIISPNTRITFGGLIYKYSGRVCSIQVDYSK